MPCIALEFELIFLTPPSCKRNNYFRLWDLSRENDLQRSAIYPLPELDSVLVSFWEAENIIRYSFENGTWEQVYQSDKHGIPYNYCRIAAFARIGLRNEGHKLVILENVSSNSNSYSRFNAKWSIRNCDKYGKYSGGVIFMKPFVCNLSDNPMAGFELFGTECIIFATKRASEMYLINWINVDDIQVTKIDLGGKKIHCFKSAPKIQDSCIIVSFYQTNVALCKLKDGTTFEILYTIEVGTYVNFLMLFDFPEHNMRNLILASVGIVSAEFILIQVGEPEHFLITSPVLDRIFHIEVSKIANLPIACWCQMENNIIAMMNKNTGFINKRNIILDKI